MKQQGHVERRASLVHATFHVFFCRCLDASKGPWERLVTCLRALRFTAQATRKQLIMKFLYVMLAAVLVLSPLYSAQAEVFHTVSSGTYSWEDPHAWMGAVSPGDEIDNFDTVIINTDVVLMTHLGLKPKAVLQINDTLTIFQPNGHAAVISKGRIEVMGTLRVVAGIDGAANVLSLMPMAELVVSGTFENLGAEVINDGNIAIASGGGFRNFGFRDASDDDLVRAEDGSVYELPHFGSTLFGYTMDDGFSGHTGGPNSPNVQDTAGFGNVSWTCYAGLLDNSGSFSVAQGGNLHAADCGGGLVLGNSIGLSCHAPTNLRVQGSNANGLTFLWDPVAAARSYMIGLKPAGSPKYRIVRPVQGGVTQYSFPANFFPTGVQADWAVLSVCQKGRLDLSYLSTSTATLNRQAATGSYTDAVIRSFPNPVDDRLHIEVHAPEVLATVRIMDLQGRLVEEHQLAMENNRLSEALPTGELAEGMYVLQILAGDKAHQETLMVSR